MPNWRHLAVLVALVALVHGNSMGGTFHFDDHHSLVNNPHIRQLDVAAALTDASLFSRNPGSDMYRPVVLLSYALNYLVGGLEPWGFLLVNLLIHTATVVVGYLLLCQVIGATTLPFAAAALFAVHPLTTQVVNYVSSRSESLAGLFGLLSLYAYRRGGRGALLASLAAFTLALGSKSVAIAVPVVLLAWALQQREVGFHRRQWPFWLLSVTYLTLQQSQLAEAFVEAPVRDLSAQLWTQLKGFVYYLRLFTVPHPLTIEHDFAVGRLSSTATVACVVLAASIVYLAYRQRHSGSGLGLATWALLVAAPVALVPLNVLVSEHRVYAALPPLMALLVWNLRDVRMGRGVCTATVVLFAVLSAQRSGVWATEETVWLDAAAKTTLAARPHAQLGALYRGAGRLDEAEAHLTEALRRDPDLAPAYNTLGNVFQARGNIEDAEDAYDAALRLLPRYPEALINLGALRARQHRWNEALALYEQALRVAPQRFEALNNAATACMELGEYLRAESLLRAALGQRHESAPTRYNLGGALEGQGRIDEALLAYEAAAAADPSYARPWLKIARIAEAAADDERARFAYQTFLRLWTGDRAVAAAVRQQLQSLTPAKAGR